MLRAGDDDAVVGQDRPGWPIRSAPPVRRPPGSVDLAVYFVDAGTCRRGTAPRSDGRSRAACRGREQADVVRVVVDHDAGVGPDPVQLGVDVDGGRDVPAAADHVAVLVDHADVGGGELLPPQSPRVDPHVGLTVGPPGDVAGHVLGEADAGEVAERERHRLFVGEVDADGRHLRRRPHLQAAAPHSRSACVDRSRSSVDRISSRSRPLAILPPDDRGSSSRTSSRSGSSSLETPCCRRCSTRAGRSSAAACLELDEHADPLAEERVGHRDRRGHGDGGVGRHGVLDLDRADVLAAAEDEVRGAAGQGEVAVGVELADVAHPHPAVLREQLVVVGATEVSEAERGAAACGLSAPRFGDVAIPVEQPHLHLRHDPARGAQPAVQRVREGGRAEHPGLVGAVELQDRDAGQLLELGGLRVGQRLAAGEHHAQAGQVVVP